MNQNHLLLITTFVFAACSEREGHEDHESLLIEQAKQQIVASLKDPDSAQFRKMRWEKSAELVLLCGEVNAKNSMGGYVGFKPFWAAQPGLVESGKFDPSYPLQINMDSKGMCR